MWRKITTTTAARRSRRSRKSPLRKNPPKKRLHRRLRSTRCPFVTSVTTRSRREYRCLLFGLTSLDFLTNLIAETSSNPDYAFALHRGPFITALGRIWCPDHFICHNGNCKRPLADIGFVEEKGDLYCEYCFEEFLAPVCSKCNARVKVCFVTIRTKSHRNSNLASLNTGRLPQRHRQAVPPGVLQVHLLRQAVRQQPVLPGGG